MKEDVTLNSNKLESPSTQNALRQDWLTSPAVLEQKWKIRKVYHNGNISAFGSGELNTIEIYPFEKEKEQMTFCLFLPTYQNYLAKKFILYLIVLHCKIYFFHREP